jgi:hypothetical protein
LPDRCGPGQKTHGLRRYRAQRVAALADDNQVIVFTHDIFFATTLLSLFEKSKRCRYFHVTDGDGKGEVTRATGPRWDSLANLRKNINETIQAAQKEGGEARAALVRTGCDWIRAWCEVFVETELLQGVTQRYQPNVRMTSLPQIGLSSLAAHMGTMYRAGNAWRGKTLQVCIVASSVQLAYQGTIVRVHPIRHDRAKEHGAFATPHGRPRKQRHDAPGGDDVKAKPLRGRPEGRALTPSP